MAGNKAINVMVFIPPRPYVRVTHLFNILLWSNTKTFTLLSLPLLLFSCSCDTRSAWMHTHKVWVVPRVMPRHLVVATRDWEQPWNLLLGPSLGGAATGSSRGQVSPEMRPSLCR